MKKKVGCLHAHYSNIEYIQNALPSNNVEWIHFVDPGLMRRITADPSFDESKAKDKVLEQMKWISQSNVDAILITCTNYIALLDEDRLNPSIPIIKIDEPFFHDVCNTTGPQILLFTNPATVKGTMGRLADYAAAHGKSVRDIEARVIENTFDLFMQGNKDQYTEELSRYMKGLFETETNTNISVAQLSMVETAEKMEREWDVIIGNPLKPLAALFE